MDLTGKKKILFYISSLARGGAERVFVNLAEYFKTVGYDVYMVTQYRQENEYPLHPEVPRILSELKAEELTKSRRSNFTARLKKLKRIFQEINPDIVMACNGKNNMMALAASKGLKCKVVLSVIADPKMEYYTRIMRLIAKTFFVQADGIVIQTEETRRFFPAMIQKKCRILPNSLNTDFIKPRYTGERDKRIISVGRLDANKNQAMLIQAFADIASDFPEYKVELIGEGEAREELEALVKALHLEERVSLAGRKNNIPDYIGTASVFVLTSYTEGMPNALIEAMALGLPVISTDCPSGGPRHLIKNGENGILIPPGETDCLREALIKILSDEQYQESLGQQAYQVQTELAPDKVNALWQSYFEELISKGC